MFKKFYIQISLLFLILAIIFFGLIFFYSNNIGSLKRYNTQIYKSSVGANSIENFKTETQSIFIQHDQIIKKIEDDSFSFLVLGIIFITGILMNIIPLFSVSLNSILDGITRFKQGTKNYRIRLNSKSEFGIIADYLDKTFETVEKYEKEISDLISITSHQLKTPISISKGNISMLLENETKNLTSEQLGMINDVYKTQENMYNLIISLLDADKLDKNVIEFNLEKINPLLEINKIVDGLGDYTKKNNLNIQVEANANDKFILADKFRIGQIFRNLIDNAIRYSSVPTQINIWIRIVNYKLVISFKDNGIGIPESEKSKIFNRFYRASNAIRFKEGGTGLGLYIIKSMTDKMNGRVWFESTEGKGTTFYLEFSIV